MRRRGERVLGPYRHRSGWRLIHAFADGSRAPGPVQSKDRCLKEKARIEASIAVAARTIDEAIDAYERHMTAKGNKPKSVKETARRMRRFFPTLDLELDALTPQRAAYDALKTMAPDSHLNMLAEAKTFLRWCVAQAWLRVSPLADVKGEGKRRHGKPQLRLDEARSWRAKAHELAAAGDAQAVAALMTLTMGLRVTEIVSRKVRDLDDGGKMLWVEDAKTESGNRTVLVPEELRGYLALIVTGRDREAWVFPAVRSRTGHRDRKWPLTGVQRICEAAKVPEVTAHGQRGLAATLAGAAAILAGSGLDAVSGTLGHVDTRTTTTAYANKDELEKARRRRTITVLDGGKK